MLILNSWGSGSIYIIKRSACLQFCLCMNYEQSFSKQNLKQKLIWGASEMSEVNPPTALVVQVNTWNQHWLELLV